jgi:hypothetical protein
VIEMAEKGGKATSPTPESSTTPKKKKPTLHQPPPPATPLPNEPHPNSPVLPEDLEMTDLPEASPELIRLPTTPPTQQATQAPPAPQTPPSPLGGKGLQGLQGLQSQQRPQSQQGFQFAFKPVLPLKALKLGTKRQRPSSPDRLEDPEDQLEGHLAIALTALQAAQKIRPSFQGLVRAVQQAISSLANPQPPAQPAQKLSFAAVAQKGLGDSQWNTVTKNKASQPKVQKAKTQRARQQPAQQQPEQQPQQPQPPKQTAEKPTQHPRQPKATKKAHPNEGLQLILRLKKTATRPTFDSLKLRNQLNSALGAIAIYSLELSTRGNIVITTIAPYTAKQLLEEKPKWASLLEGYTVEEAQLPASWIKLVAYGTLNRPEVGPIGAFFTEEAKTFNGIEVLGEPRWLKQPVEGQESGSVLFAVPTEAMATRCRKLGLAIAGKKVTIARYREFTPTTQCYRCLAYGHNPRECRKPVKCAICPEKHITRDHSCSSCKASGPCSHYKPYCHNCKGDHRANDKAQCEVYRSITHAK